VRRWAVLAAGALLLTGCAAGDPRAERQRDVEAVVLAANDRDAAAVQEAVEALLSTIREQVANGDVEREEGERLRAIALRIVEAAPALSPVPSPPPTPAPPSPEPSPEPTEEPSPTPEPEEPSPTPEPEEPEEPEESPEVEVPVEVTPAAQPSEQPQPTPEPTAAA
jgi:outer membrane biosynthesis protein TonB